MAIIKVVNSKSKITAAIGYIADKKKTLDGELVSGINCSSNPDDASKEMQDTKEQWGKTEGRSYKHYVQSFDVMDTEKITPQQAHQMAYEWAEKSFIGYEVLITTHTNTKYMHSHIIVNSVNFETGKKYQECRQDLQKLKDTSDEIVKQYGFKPQRKSPILRTQNNETYWVEKRYRNNEIKSWLGELKDVVSYASNVAESKKEFTEILGNKNIKVDWQENHKYIVFTDEAGHKARDKKISEMLGYAINKEKLISSFEKNAEHKKERQARKEKERLADEEAKRNQEREEAKKESDKMEKIAAEKLLSEIDQKIRETLQTTDPSHDIKIERIGKWIKQYGTEQMSKLWVKAQENNKNNERHRNVYFDFNEMFWRNKKTLVEIESSEKKGLDKPREETKKKVVEREMDM